MGGGLALGSATAKENEHVGTLNGPFRSLRQRCAHPSLALKMKYFAGEQHIPSVRKRRKKERKKNELKREQLVLNSKTFPDGYSNSLVDSVLCR